MMTHEQLIAMPKMQTLSPSTLDNLVQMGSTKKLKRGAHLFFDKDNGSTVYLVLCGMVCIYKVTQKSDKKVVFVMGKGDFVNEEVLNDCPMSSHCEVIEDATVLCMPKDSLLEAMSQDFELTKVIVASLSLKVRRLYRQLKNTTGTVRMDKKLAAKLWKLSIDYGETCPEGTRINFDIHVTFLAEMLGSTRETISRQLKHLQEKQLILIKNNDYIVPDRDVLSCYFKED